MEEVIAFLIEHFQDIDACPPANDLGQLLEEVGFDDAEIGNALMFLEVLSDLPVAPLEEQSSGAMRVYCPEELDALPQDILGLLHFLEQADAINSVQREFVIHALLHLPAEEIDLNTAKVLALLVLWAHRSELPNLIGDELMVALHGKAVMH